MEENNVKNIRKLASIREVKEIFSIDGADKIDAVKIDGWICVCKKGEFNALGELGIYFEIDAFLPSIDSRYAFLEKEFILFEGIMGARLRTRKFRGQLAQGLFLPLNFYPELANYKLGDDVTEVLGIKKWEPYMSPQLSGIALGLFPNKIRKTDQERCISENTLIDTEDGKKTIKEIVETKYQGKVVSFNHQTNSIEMKQIIDWSSLENNNNWLKIILESGKKLIVTNNHKIWSIEKKIYQDAIDFKVNDLIQVSI